jgi:hypothetical protein
MLIVLKNMRFGRSNQLGVNYPWTLEKKAFILPIPLSIGNIRAGTNMC